MASHSLEDLAQVLEALMEAELTLSAFYEACAERWPDNADFWLALSGEEVQHAERVSRLARIILERMAPERHFEFYRPITVDSVRTFISGIRGNIEKVKQGTLCENNVLILALDIERSILERKYFEIVKTQDIEYLEVSKSILADTRAHRGRIEDRVARRSGK